MVRGIFVFFVLGGEVLGLVGVGGCWFFDILGYFLLGRVVFYVFKESFYVDISNWKYFIDLI